MTGINDTSNETTANPNEQQKKLRGCVDYRKYLFSRLIWVDDGLAERGMTWQLLYIMIHLVLMVIFGLVSFFFSTLTKARLDNFRCVFLESLVSMALFNEYLSRKSLSRLYRYMDESMKKSRTGLPEEEDIIEKAKSLAKKYVAVFRAALLGNFFTMVLSQPVVELLQGKSWKKLPFPWAIPESDVAFYMVFLFQTLGLYFSSCLGMVFMSFTSITIQMTALFDVLLLSINRIEDRCANKMKAHQTDRCTALYECVKADVIHYQELVREVISITPHLQGTFLASSMTVSMIMACEAYPLVMGNFTIGELIKGLIFLSLQFVNWSQICGQMEIMADQNTAVFHALYGTPWYESEPRCKKLVLTTLIFSTRPMYIKSPLFTDMSATMATFNSFVVSSFNILNMIRKLK